MKDSAPFKIGSALVKGIANIPLWPVNAYQRHKTRKERGGVNTSILPKFAEIYKYPDKNVTIKSYPYAPHFDLGMKGIKKTEPYVLEVDQTIDLRPKPKTISQPEYEVAANREIIQLPYTEKD